MKEKILQSFGYFKTILMFEDFVLKEQLLLLCSLSLQEYISWKFLREDARFPVLNLKIE